MLLPINEVYDGDTIKTQINRLPEELKYISIRVKGIDTPEMPAPSYSETGKLGRANCHQEALTAIAARNAVITLIGDSTSMKVENFEWDKYGGRILADVKINGHYIKDFLIEKGYAVEYDGGTKTYNWCE